MYATSADFCNVFAENMDSMHLLSFLLTADHRKAEECFVTGLEDCVKGRYVFRDWARSWARRTIIQNAVRMLAPRPERLTSAPIPEDPINCNFGQTPEANAAIASILELENFERFVFVISVLEKYSDQDCSILLGSSRQNVLDARMRALQHVAELYRMGTVAGSGIHSNTYEETQTRVSDTLATLVIGPMDGFPHRDDLLHSAAQMVPPPDGHESERFHKDRKAFLKPLETV